MAAPCKCPEPLLVQVLVLSLLLGPSGMLATRGQLRQSGGAIPGSDASSADKVTRGGRRIMGWGQAEQGMTHELQSAAEAAGLAEQVASSTQSPAHQSGHPHPESEGRQAQGPNFTLGRQDVNAAEERKCIAPPKIDFERLEAEMTENNAESEPGRSRLLVLDWVCVDQGVVVLYDPNLFDDTNPVPLPRFDLSAVQYFYRHSPQRAAEEKMEALEGRGYEPHLNNTKFVKGGPLSFLEPRIRLASSIEFKQLTSPFSECTVPLVYAGHWIHNLGEFFARAPAWLWTFQEQRNILPEDVTLAVLSPAKVPVLPFVLNLLRPFSKYEPVDFADLSSRLPEDYPSNSTFEGTHKRCFRKLMLWRATGGTYPAMPPAAQHVMQYYKPQIDELAARDGHGFWSNSDQSNMRVLVEHRPDTGARQLINLNKLLEACNQSPGALLKGMDSDGASAGHTNRYRTVECRSHEFVSRGFLHDLMVMQEADVFVGLHGAGEINSYFMPEHSSIIEIRGNNANKMWAANIWNPLISHQSGFKLFWWGLFIEDPELVSKSVLEQEGIDDDPVRDQNVELKWEHLLPMLQKVAQADKNPDAFRVLWGEKADHVVFDVKQGGQGLVPHGKLFE